MKLNYLSRTIKPGVLVAILTGVFWHFETPVGGLPWSLLAIYFVCWGLIIYNLVRFFRAKGSLREDFKETGSLFRSAWVCLFFGIGGVIYGVFMLIKSVGSTQGGTAATIGFVLAAGVGGLGIFLLVRAFRIGFSFEGLVLRPAEKEEEEAEAEKRLKQDA